MKYLILVVCTYLFIKYIEPCLDWVMEVFVVNMSEIITKHNLNIQKLTAEMFREYPELSNNLDNTGQTSVIGFQCYGENDEVYEEEQDKLYNGLNKNGLNNKYNSKLINMNKRMVF